MSASKLEQSGKRSFTIVEMKSKKKIKNKTNGRYISRSAKGAAIKAFNRECRESKIRGICTFNILMKETTRGSKKNIYKFKVNRKKLKTPLKIQKGDVTILIKYKTTGKLIEKIES